MACVTKRRGRYVIDFYDTKGKRKWITMPEGTTKKRAKEKLREIEDQLRRGIYLPDKRIPLFKEIAKDWLTYKKPNIRASTWGCYEGHVRNHFSKVNDIRVNRITVAKVETFISDHQQEGMNIITLRKVLVTFGQIMAYAVRHRYIDFNPIRDAERPRDQGEVRKKKIRVLIPNEITAFLDAVDSQKYKILFMLAIMSGARQGELIGLKWTDVDWFNNQIHIQRTFNNGAWYRPKTKTSDRKIDLGSTMMAELRKWKLACPKNKLDLVFPNKVGNVIHNGTMLEHFFHPAVKKAGIQKLRFHDLRHTYASLLIEQGENIKYIASQLGHSTPTITLEVYAHLLKLTNPESALRLENTIFSTTGSKMVAK